MENYNENYGDLVSSKQFLFVFLFIFERLK